MEDFCIASIFSLKCKRRLETEVQRGKELKVWRRKGKIRKSEKNPREIEYDCQY